MFTKTKKKILNANNFTPLNFKKFNLILTENIYSLSIVFTVVIIVVVEITIFIFFTYLSSLLVVIHINVLASKELHDKRD